MFALPIEIEPDVPCTELLEGAAAETILAIEGTLQLEGTFGARREFVKQRRQQQEARRQRAKRAMSRHDVSATVNDLPILAIADVGMHSEAGTTKPSKPRKRVSETEGATSVIEATETEELVSAAGAC